MEFPKTSHFDIDIVRSKIMGPNTCKLTEEFLRRLVSDAQGDRSRALHRVCEVAKP